MSNIQEIHSRLADINGTIMELCHEAGVNPSTYHRALKSGRIGRTYTAELLEKAITHLEKLTVQKRRKDRV